jgi:hypothetical protein
LLLVTKVEPTLVVFAQSKTTVATVAEASKRRWPVCGGLPRYTDNIDRLSTPMTFADRGLQKKSAVLVAVCKSQLKIEAPGGRKVRR